MSRDLEDDKYYTSSGGLIPIKWSAIEVSPGIVVLNFSCRHYVPKQALHYKKYSTASDVWSFGVLMHVEIWSLGHIPFDKITHPQVIHDCITESESLLSKRICALVHIVNVILYADC